MSCNAENFSRRQTGFGRVPVHGSLLRSTEVNRRNVDQAVVPNIDDMNVNEALTWHCLARRSDCSQTHMIARILQRREFLS